MRPRPAGAVSASTLLDVIVILAAVAVAFAIYADRRDDSVRLARPDWEALLRSDLAIGPSDAKVRVVEFVDYQCPMCFVAEGVLSDLASEHPAAIQRIIRHFPLTRIHPRADSAAAAALCAAEQGAFRVMHEALFAHRELVERGMWDSLVVIAAVENRARFSACFTSDEVRRRVAADFELGRRLGVNSTPTLVINRELLRSVDPVKLRVSLLGRVD
ncbi:MAG TPA: thioredoxin domain-containing protein [Gemmatimonadaceae bacterium]